MAAPVQCDICRELPGRYWVTDSDTGQVTTMCPGCFAMIGMTAFLSGDADLVDGVLKERGFVPSAAEKKRRKDDAEPEYDANRVIAAVVESAPTPPGDDQVITPDQWPDAVREAAETLLVDADTGEDKPPY